MKKFKLYRLASLPTHTEGVLVGEKGIICQTMERPWLNNERNVSCIPAGEYTATVNMSNRFGKELPLILGVAGRSGIRIHAGNRVGDSTGCILPGLRWGTLGSERAVLSSRDAMDLIFDALDGDDRFTLEVVE